MRRVASVLAVSALMTLGWPSANLLGQEELVVRTPPPPLEDFESDANRDGVPDGWYNLRDGKVVAEGGMVGPHFLRFENDKIGRPARLSRAFGVDGRKAEAIVLGFWLRLDKIRAGERLGEDPGLVMDFLGEQLRTASRGALGPWPRLNDSGRWTRVAKRIAVPPNTLDVIISIGLLGATGVMDVDGLTIELVPRGGSETTNLVVNGDFELGDPDPSSWIVDGGARRVSPGLRSSSCVELGAGKSSSRAMTGLGIPIEPFPSLEISLMARARGLRGSGGALAQVFFLDEGGRILPVLPTGVLAFRWSGSFDWKPERVVMPVPPRAVRAVLQFEKHDANGSLQVDDVSVTASPNAQAGAWTPYHVEDDTTGWLPVAPSPRIDEASALDASFLLDAPAGKHGFVTVRDKRLAFEKGGRARFFGMTLLAPTPFVDRARADALVDRLARSGINLVRLGDLDTALGPERSLFDDSRDDTRALDPISLAKLDHLIAALKARGIYVALELQSVRRYRSEDGVADFAQLPNGGGPAAELDEALKARQLEAAEALLGHVNPETGLALRDDPVLAWVTLAGEITLFDQIENPGALPPAYAAELKKVAQAGQAVAGRRLWQSVGSAHWKEFASKLREEHLRVPIAGVSHWRREPEFAAVQATPGLDMIDDRLYWSPTLWGDPERCSILWSHNGALAAPAAAKRKADRPYVVGQWCHQTMGAWAYRFEGADILLASQIAHHEDWDALVRRGIFVYPQTWGTNSSGTGGGEDIYQIPEAVNGIPQAFALWPHAASLMLRGQPSKPRPGASSARGAAAHRRSIVPGWDPDNGRVAIDTPYTQGLAGWPGRDAAVFETLEIKTDNAYAAIVASSVGDEPIATTRRLLLTAVARVEPTGYRWVDGWKRDVADPGRPPLLQEPIEARVRWRREGVKAFALDNSGARVGPAKLATAGDGVELIIDGETPTLHWELVVE